MKFVIVIERAHQCIELQGDENGKAFPSLRTAEKAMASRSVWANQQGVYVLPIGSLARDDGVTAENVAGQQASLIQTAEKAMRALEQYHGRNWRTAQSKQRAAARLETALTEWERVKSH